MYYFLIHFKYVIFVNLIQVFLPMIHLTQNARNHDSLTTDVIGQIVQNIIVFVRLFIPLNCQKNNVTMVIYNLK